MLHRNLFVCFFYMERNVYRKREQHYGVKKGGAGMDVWEWEWEWEWLAGNLFLQQQWTRETEREWGTETETETGRQGDTNHRNENRKVHAFLLLPYNIRRRNRHKYSYMLSIYIWKRYSKAFKKLTEDTIAIYSVIKENMLELFGNCNLFSSFIETNFINLNLIKFITYNKSKR